MTNTYKIICKLISTALFGNSFSYNENIDWADVFDEMKIQGIATIIGDCIKEIPMDCGIKEKWQDYILLQLLQWEKMISIQNDVCKIFSETSYAIIKGMSAAIYYSNPKLRSIGDIDVLVARNNFNAAQNLLNQNEYSVIPEKGTKHSTYSKKHIRIEIHNSVSHWLTETGKRTIENLMLEGLNNICVANFLGNKWMMLPVKESGLSLIYHIYHHFRIGVGFRQVLDWMMFVHNTNNIDWNDFNKATKEDGLYKLQCSITKMCCIYFGLPETEDIKWMQDVDDQTCEDLFGYFAYKGNFGRKKRGLVFGDKFAYDNKFKGFFARLQLGGMQRWKAQQRYKILSPFAWLYQGVRVITIMIRRKEPLKAIKKDMDESKKIIRLYDELGFKRVDCTSI